MPAHSGLQREVLALYRHSLRIIRTKPVADRPAFKRKLDQQFRDPSVGKRDTEAVEYLMRRWRNTLEYWGEEGVRIR
ncbi:hypothetical protein BT69DRAFT_1330431 [Atractiella rhizophila]|nr:hypothetical protein BT69DRAFT_1330431 [Atractiella rhizophila]